MNFVFFSISSENFLREKLKFIKEVRFLLSINNSLMLIINNEGEKAQSINKKVSKLLIL